MQFAELGLADYLLKALSANHYQQPYPIQEQAIPAILKGKDIMGIAQTGSGKTASFVLPILQMLQSRPAPRNRHIQALVLVPTRELAQQVGDVFKLFEKYLPLQVKSMAVFGGVSINPQMIKLQGVDILVATPGRLLDLTSSKSVFLTDVEFLVLDEADKMLNMGFQEEMKQIFRLLPAKRQTLLFSATIGQELGGISDALLRTPMRIEIKEEEANLDLITQRAYRVEEEKKGPLLRHLIKNEEMTQVLVFASSIHRADAIAAKLNANNIQAMAMHSQKSQGARNEALNSFKSGKTRVLVATDIMARGIDIPALPFVINYELPRSPKDYVHRIGRTGRAETPGTAISLVSAEEEHHFGVIQKKMKKKVELLDISALAI